MAQHYRIPLDAPGEWHDALQGIRHSFGHTWENCYAMHLTTGLATYLYSYVSGDVRVVCPIVEREYDGCIDILKPFGFSGFVANGTCPEFPLHWKDFARQRGYVCGYLGLNPLFDYSAHFPPEEVHEYGTIHYLDLRPGLDELWANLSTNRKRQLKNWDSISSGLVLDKAPLIDFFLATYVDFFDRKQAPGFYYFSRETLLFLFNLDNVLMVGAPSPENVESVSVFVYTADAGEYLFNISLPGCNHHAAALMWQGITRLKSLGVPLLNMGGGSSEFKRRFGSRDLPQKSLKQIYEPAVYEKLCRLGNVDPHDHDGYFPPYHGKERPGA